MLLAIDDPREGDEGEWLLAKQRRESGTLVALVGNTSQRRNGRKESSASAFIAAGRAI
ncbi:MAG TPA: hypothetical protein VIY49_15090 [Bryobacteraceae bacterium]